MPIRDHIEIDGSFQPEDTAAIIEAFEHTLKDLGLVDRRDPVVLLVARKIIELAKQGHRDPDQLRAATIASLGARRL